MMCQKFKQLLTTLEKLIKYFALAYYNIRPHLKNLGQEKGLFHYSDPEESNKNYYSHFPSVREGLAEIIRSMADHQTEKEHKSVTLSLQRELVPGLAEQPKKGLLTFTISDKDQHPHFVELMERRELLSGDTFKAVNHLWGFGIWRMIFKVGSDWYEISMLADGKPRLYTGSPPNGFTHKFSIWDITL